MHDDIERRAYALWEADGRPHGQDQAFWFKAASELALPAAKVAAPAGKRAPRAKKSA